MKEEIIQEVLSVYIEEIHDSRATIEDNSNFLVIYSIIFSRPKELLPKLRWRQQLLCKKRLLANVASLS